MIIPVFEEYDVVELVVYEASEVVVVFVVGAVNNDATIKIRVAMINDSLYYCSVMS
jgi:hypothetical protein